MEKVFEYAAKNKLRFPYKGAIATEDLFDLTRNALDSIYKQLISTKKTEENEESLMVSAVKTKEQEDLEVKIAIVKYVFNVKTQEQLDKVAEQEKKQKKQRIMNLIAEKQDEQLKNTSMEDLQKMLAEME